MSRRRFFGLAISIVASLASAATVFGGPHVCDSCPKCDNKVCQPSPEVKKEKKTVYDVACKDVCIPGIRWPWQACCEPNCGKVKTVKVLKKYERECEKCGTKWTVVGGCEPCQK